jgi:hypothetical protein
MLTLEGFVGTLTKPPGGGDPTELVGVLVTVVCARAGGTARTRANMATITRPGTSFRSMASTSW